MGYGRYTSFFFFAIGNILLYCEAADNSRSLFETRIVGGKVSARQYPWIASLRTEDDRHFCGGSLVASNLVLTAAHCVRFDSLRATHAVFREYQIGSPNPPGEKQPLRRAVVSTIVHPEYEASSYDNDVAILVIEPPISNSDIRPVKRIRTSTEEKPGAMVTIAGWGVEDEADTESSKNLMITEVPVVDRKSCQRRLRITETMMCAGFLQGGKDSCKGDSGGPLFVDQRGSNSLQVGVVSWGIGCARPYLYGVYTRLSSLQDFLNAPFRIGNCQGHIEPLEAPLPGTFVNYFLGANWKRCWRMRAPGVERIFVNITAVDDSLSHGVVTVYENGHEFVGQIKNSTAAREFELHLPVNIEWAPFNSSSAFGFNVSFKFSLAAKF